MKTLALGPGDLARSLDEGFFLPREALIRLQVYAYQASALPVDAVELSESLFGTSSGEGEKPDKDVRDLITRLATLFADMAQQADDWHREIHPGIVGTAHLVSQYAVKSNRVYDTLLDTIRGLHRDPYDSVLRTRLQRLAERLATEANLSLAATQAVQGKLRAFVAAAEGDRKALEPVRGALSKRYQTEDTDLEKIDTQLSTAEDDLAAANAAYAKDVTAASIAVAYVAAVNIFMGITIVAAFAVGIAATVDSAKAKAEIDAAIETIKTLKERKITALRVRAALRLAQRTVNEIAVSADAVQPALEKAIRGWEKLAGDIDRLKSAATDDPASVPLLFREAEIEAARVAWQRLARAADDFRAHAYIRILPEEVEDEGGAESKDENAAEKGGAEARSKEDAHGQQ